MALLRSLIVGWAAFLQTWRSYGAEKERGARLEGIQRSAAESPRDRDLRRPRPYPLRDGGELMWEYNFALSCDRRFHRVRVIQLWGCRLNSSTSLVRLIGAASFVLCSRLPVTPRFVTWFGAIEADWFAPSGRGGVGVVGPRALPSAKVGAALWAALAEFAPDKPAFSRNRIINLHNNYESDTSILCLCFVGLCHFGWRSNSNDAAGV